MPSTQSRRLSDYLKPFAPGGTSSLKAVEMRKDQTRISENASSGATDRMLYYSNGRSAIQKIKFVPEIAIASSATEKVVLTLVKMNTSGGGDTTLGSFSTYASDSATVNSALAQYVVEDIYSPATEYVMADDESIRVDIAVTTASSITIQGFFAVEYIPLLN